MTMYAGDEYYDDDVTSGLWHEGLEPEPYEPNPYDGTYSEE